MHVQLRIDLHDDQILDGDLIDAHVASAVVALEDTGRIGAAAIAPA